MIAELVVVFFGLAVGGTGPAYREWLDRRRARRDRPLAQVLPFRASYDLRFRHGLPDDQT